MVLADCFLFGSVARGDADGDSDKDVLIVYQSEPSLLARKQTKSLITNEWNSDCSFAEYTSKHLASLFRGGHLFAWHLFYEARQLHISGLSSSGIKFAKPAPYLSVREDVANFTTLLESCVFEFERNQTSMVYEAGLAYVAIRNIGMSLGAELLSRPEFGRYVPFSVARALGTKKPCELALYDLLVAARHASQRGKVAPHFDSLQMLLSLRSALFWAKNILGNYLETND